MVPKSGKARQATVEPESSGGEASGEAGGELVHTASQPVIIPSDQRSMIPGIPQSSLDSLIALIGGMVDQRMQRFEQRMDERFGLSPQALPTTEAPEAPYQPYQPPVYEKPQPVLRAEEVGYFDPEYQDPVTGPIVNAGKYIYYRDVFIFVDRLKDLASQPQNNVKHVISSCFRGTALMWYSMELTELERDLLRDAELDRWYTTLIDRFKVRTSAALAQLTSQSYSLADIKSTSPRAWIQQMLHLSKSAGLDSIYHQLLLIWNQLAISIRRDIPEPQETTTIGQFLKSIDAKTDIWIELSRRQQQRPWAPPQNPTPSRHTNGQRQYPSRSQVAFQKPEAYLADGAYGEYAEDEADQEQ